MSNTKIISIVVVCAALILFGGGYLITKYQGSADQEKSKSGETREARNNRLLAKGRLPGDRSAGTKQIGRKRVKVGSPEDTGEAGDTVTSDSLTSAAEAGMTQEQMDVDTRNRLIYEEAQRKAFKPRKTDPEKVVPAKLTDAVQDAAKKQNVPKDLLAALMYCESEGSHRGAQPSIDAGFGVMNLRENNLVDTLGEAAQLIGRSKEDCIYNQALNLEAAAALLARYHDDALASGVSDGEAWYMAISQYSGRQDPELAGELADQVSAAMQRGFKFDWGDGGGAFTQPPTTPPFQPKDPSRVAVPQTNPAPTPEPTPAASGQ